jgi:PAS domain S-box-containing protein
MSNTRAVVTPLFRPALGKRLAQAALPRRLLLLIGVVLAAGLMSLAAMFYHPRLPGAAALVYLAVTAIFALGITLLWLFAYRRGLAAAHRAVLRAQEGSLEPITVSGLAQRALGPLMPDYNALVKNLASLFGEMEQCQLWVIGERNRNDAILRSLPGALVTMDVDFRITLSNRYAENLFGHERDELRGQNLFEVLRLDEAGRELLREAFLYEQQLVNQEIVLTVGDAPRHFTLNLTFFRESHVARESCAAIVLQDVTDYRRLQDVTHQTEKLVAMGQLAAGVAHELNTPLGTIIGYAQLLTAGAADDTRRQQYQQAIYGEAKRCARIVDSLLAYARREHCQPESCDINAVIRDVVDTVNCCQAKRYNVVLSAQLHGGPLVRGGPGQLDIVLINLVMNAAQAAGGHARQPRVIISTEVDAGCARVTVADNGPGVRAEIRNRVFDPFFTTKSVGMGSGLGLAISQSIVTRIGGTLRCDAAYRGGARFVMTLPLAAPEAVCP